MCSENPMEAGKDVDRALRLRPECPEGWLLKGRVLQKVAAWSEAAEAFTVASQVPVCAVRWHHVELEASQ